MLLVLASEWDQQAAELVHSWPHARLLTPADLSISGWAYRSSVPEAAIIIAGGKPLPVSEISGVFTRLPQVMPQELLRIGPADRGYVAAEMQAFLVAWLTALRCPVVNHPSPQCLAGPAWGRERWVREAAALGLPIIEIARNSEKSALAPDVAEVVTVVGDTILGAAKYELRAHAAQLARRTQLTALAVSFEEGAFHSASPWIDVADAAVVEALADYFASAGHSR